MKYRVSWADTQEQLNPQELFSQFKFVAVFVVLFILLTIFALSNNVIADQSGTASGTITDTPTEDLATALFSSENSVSPTSAQEKEYISPEYKTDFQFNGVGLTWNGSESADVTFYISIDDGDWTVAPMIEHESKDQDEPFTSYPLFTSGSQIRYKIVGTDIALVRSVRLVYFDSTAMPDSPSTLQVIQDKLDTTRDASEPKSDLETGVSPEAESNARVISRSEWGADENLRFWDPEYTAPEFFVIHHTAGSDGGEDPAATIRGIYYWHTVVLGWGDIGYNYLIDQQGNVYEGRYGGEGVVGAHAYNSVTSTNYNQFSIGIAVLGCFETATGACNAVHKVTPEIQNAMVDLMARKAKLHSIDPKGSNEAFGEIIKNIVGHRDIDLTYCPGSRIHDDLKEIRTDVVSVIDQLATERIPKFQAQPMTGGLGTAYAATDAPQITLTYQNTGLYAWSPDEVQLRLKVHKTKKRQVVQLPEQVNKRTETELNFQWTEIPYRSGTYTVTTKLYRRGKSINKSAQRYTVEITNPYQGSLVNNTVPVAIKKSWSPVAKFTFLNSGTTAWPEETQLVIDGEVVSQLQSPVNPGEQIRIKAQLNKNNTWDQGSKYLRGFLQVGSTRIEGSRFTQHLRID